MTMVFPLREQEKKNVYWLGVYTKAFPRRENGNYEYHKAHQQQQQSISPSKWYDKNYVLFSTLRRRTVEWKRNKQQNDYDFN